jgi:chromosomal replication initiator protein
MIAQIKNNTSIEPIHNKEEKYLQLIYKTAKFFNVTSHELISKKRTSEMSEARFHLFKYASETGIFSLQFIGLMTGNRHHSTVIYGIQTLNDMMNVYKLSSEIYTNYVNFIESN